MRDLLVIGSLNMDTVIRTSHIPRAGETITGQFSAYVSGGKGANQACAAGRIGHSVAMLGVVGNDAFGDTMIENLKKSGVDTSLIERCQAQTGQALICVGDEGSNSIVVLPNANAFCNKSLIQAHEQDIADSRGVMLQMEIPHDAVFEAIRIAAKRGCKVFFNPAPASADLPEFIFPLIDYITPNETELEILTGMPVGDLQQAESAARVLIGRGVRNVVATLGSTGALLVDENGAKLYPAYPAHALDTTAAGDTFNAAFAVRVLEGAAHDEAMDFANRAASISVTRTGAQTSIPFRAEVLAMMENGGEV